MADVKILLVEDESIEAMDIKRTVESFGYEVPCVISRGEDAIKKAVKIKPDLILMDIILKDETNGIQVASRIKEFDIPVIFLTAHSEESTFQRALETDPYGYVLKPYDPTELRHAIEMALYKKKMENELKESQDQFRLLTETLDDIIYVVDLQKQKIVYMSSSVEKITGWSKESFYENSDLWMEMMLPEDRSKVISNISRIGAHDEDRKMEYRIKTRNNNFKWLSETFKVLSVEKGRPKQIIGHATDITLEKESEKHIKESEKKYRNLVDNSLVGIFRSNLRGEILFANDSMAQIFHYDSIEDLKSTNIQNLYRNSEERQLIIRKLKKEGFITNYETDALGKNGEMVRVLVSINIDREVLSGMFMDITELKHAKDKLAGTESRYKAIFDNSGTLLLTFANDGTILMFNSEWQRVSGYSAEDVEGKKWMEFVHPDYCDMMVEYHHKRLDDPESVPSRYETVFINKDGEERVMYITVSELPGTDNWLASAVDITDLKNTQKKLEKSVLRFRALAENALDGIITTGAYGKILYFNKSLEEMFGYSEEELRNSDLTVLMPERFRGNFMNDLVRFRKTGEHRLAGRTIETIGLKKDGKEFPFEMSLTKWEIENQVYFTSIIRDITERKKGEERKIKGEKALKESEKRYRTLYSSMNEGVAIHEVIYRDSHIPIDYKIIDVNRAYEEIMGINRKEVLGKKASEIYGTGEAPFLETYSEVAETGNPTNFETYFEPMDKHFEISVFSPLKGRFATVFEDITERKRASNALRESEEKYRAMMDYSSDAIFLADLDGKIIECNQKAEKLLGYSQDEILKLKFTDLHPPEELERVQRHFEMFLKGVPDSVDTLVLTKEEMQIPVAITGSLIEYGDNKVVQGIFRDITRRKKAEAALRASEDKYKTLFQSNPDYTILVGLDGVLADVNPAAEQITGIPKENLVGKRFNEVGIFPEEELGLHNEMFSHTVKHGIISPYKARIIDKKGKTRWVLNQSTIIKKEDVISHVLVIGRDITEHEKAEKARRESEEHLRFITDNMTDVIGQMDAKGNITYFSPSLKQLTGFEPQELVGKSSIDFVHPEDRGSVLNSIQEGMINKKPLSVEYRIKKKDGSYVWIETTGKVVHDENGAFKSAVIVARDVSDRKKADNALNDSLKEKEVLLREIHHRVKNNMQIISSLLNLQIQFEDQDETVGVLKESQGRVKSMSMVHEKLYQSDSFSNINFKDYVTNLVSDIFYSYGIKMGLITLEMEIEDVNIGIDTAIPLGLIVNELITNSVKYAFPEGRKGVVKIIFRSKGSKRFLTISDDGVGIPENVNPEKTESLGLQLVNNLTNQIEGEIVLDRSHGTKFEITFEELEYKERF